MEDDFDVYLTRIHWCADVGVETVGDPSGRVVQPKTFAACWVDRCRRIADKVLA